MESFTDNVIFVLNDSERFNNQEKFHKGQLSLSSTKISINYNNIGDDPIKEDLGKSSLKAIFGQTSNGEFFSAYPLQADIKPTFRQDAYNTYRYEFIISSLFIGKCFLPNKVGDLKLAKAEVRFSYLEPWLHKYSNMYGTDKELIDDNKENRNKYELNVNRFGKDDFKACIENYNVDIKVDYSYKYNTKFRRQFKWDVKNYLFYDFSKLTSLYEINRIHSIMLGFFQAMLPNHDVFIEEQYIYYQKQEIRVYIPNRYYKDEKDGVCFSNFLFHYTNATDTAKVLENWFNANDEYQEILEILPPLLYSDSFKYANHYFLSLTQWCEGFSRVYHKITDKTCFRDLIQELFKSIFPNQELFSKDNLIHPKYKEHIENMEKNTRFSPDSLEYITGDIVALRNKLTHLNQKKEVTIDYQKINDLNNILRCCIVLSVIKILGIDPKLTNTGHSFAYNFHSLCRDFKKNFHDESKKS